MSLYVCVQVCVYKHACTCVCVDIHVWSYKYIHTLLHVCMYIYVDKYMNRHSIYIALFDKETKLNK